MPVLLNLSRFFRRLFYKIPADPPVVCSSDRFCNRLEAQMAAFNGMMTVIDRFEAAGIVYLENVPGPAVVTSRFANDMSVEVFCTKCEGEFELRWYLIGARDSHLVTRYSLTKFIETIDKVLC